VGVRERLVERDTLGVTDFQLEILAGLFDLITERLTLARGGVGKDDWVGGKETLPRFDKREV
jgi:hypothetical protein